MIEVFKKLGAIVPLSKEMLEGAVVRAVELALKEQSHERLVLALEKLPTVLGPEVEKTLKGIVVAQDWPQGFEAIIKRGVLSWEWAHGKTERQSNKSLMASLMDARSYKLAAHLWGELDKDTQVFYAQKCKDLRFAVELLKIEEGMLLRGLSKRLISEAIKVLAGTSEDSGKFEREEVLGVLKVFVKDSDKIQAGQDWWNVILWKELCKSDSIALCEELAQKGLISEHNTKVNKPFETIGNLVSASKTPRFAKEWWREWNGQHASWHKKGKLDREFNLAELVCLFSTGRHQVLGALVQNEEFRSQMLGSPVARHALIVASAQSVWGVAVLSELKQLGVSLATLRGGEGQTPLHVACSELSDLRKPDQKELVSALLNVCPEWTEIKNEKGELPIQEIRPDECNREAEVMFEAAVIRLTIEQGKGPEEVIGKKLRM